MGDVFINLMADPLSFRVSLDVLFPRRNFPFDFWTPLLVERLLLGPRLVLSVLEVGEVLLFCRAFKATSLVR